MLSDGLYGIIKYEYYEPDANGRITVRLWFSDSHDAKWPVWGHGATKEEATNAAIETFLANRFVDMGRAARILRYGEVVTEKEAKRREKWAGRLIVPMRYAPPEVQKAFRQKKNRR